MKHTLRLILTLTFLLSCIFSFAEKKTNDNLACPTANISYTGNPFCSSDTNLQAVTLTGTDAYLGGFFTSSAGLSLNPTTGAFTPNTSSPGVYDITYTISAGGTCGNIYATTSITILPSNTVSSASSYPTLCVNTALPAITHTTTGATGIGAPSGLPTGITASWSGNTITISGTSTIAGLFNYSIPLTGGCGTTYASGVINILMGPGNTTISGGTTTCAGTPVNLIVTGTPNVVFTMTDGSNSNSYTIGTSGVKTISVTPTITTTYTLTSASLNSCSTAVSGSESSATVIVTPTPGAPISLPTYEICSGETANLTIATSPNIAGSTLEWTVTDSQNVTGFINGTGLSTASINDVLINSSNVQGFVKYSVTSKLGNCEGGTTDYIIYVNPLPNPVLNNGHICVNVTSGVTYQSYMLDTQLSNPNYTYDWYLLNTNTNTFDQIAGANASTYEAIEAGNYQVIVTNTNTYCIGITQADVVEISPATGILTTVTEASTDGTTITVTVDPIGTGNLIYAIDNGNWQESNVITGVTAGSHVVLVSDLEGCTNLSSVVVIENVPVTDLVMYPNPAFDSFSFNNINKVMSVQISNQMGQTVLFKDFNTKTGTIDLSDLNIGIYNIVFETESGIVNQRIIKQ